jgi:hypothetical protein
MHTSKCDTHTCKFKYHVLVLTSTSLQHFKACCTASGSLLLDIDNVQLTIPCFCANNISRGSPISNDVNACSAPCCSFAEELLGAVRL